MAVAVNWFRQKKIESEFQLHKCWGEFKKKAEGLHPKTTSDPFAVMYPRGSVMYTGSTPVFPGS